MPTLLPLLALLTLSTLDNAADPAAPAPLPPTARFEAPKYGVKASIPKEWPIAVREEEDRVFVALIKQNDPDRPGVVACEIGLAPENLDEYRTRIDGNAQRGSRTGRKLTRNQVVKAGDGAGAGNNPRQGDRLETIWEFRPSSGGLWREVSVRLLAHRQMYTFTLNVDDASYAEARPAFEALIASTELSPPNTGADLLDKTSNRWVQREFKFAIDLPESWRPVLAPSEVALFFANAPASGIWSDNVLVLAQPHGPLDLETLAKEVPDQLRKVEPNCEVLACEVVKQGKIDALETVVRTQRGPFSMTVLERRFRGGRFDYEVKYTLESKRFDAMAPALRKSLDSFTELPGSVPASADKPT